MHIEEPALALIGKKKRLRPADFRQATQRAGIDENVLTRMLTRFARIKPAWHAFIAGRFVPAHLQAQLYDLFGQRFAQGQLV